jgi:hypothetical protein
MRFAKSPRHCACRPSLPTRPSLLQTPVEGGGKPELLIAGEHREEEHHGECRDREQPGHEQHAIKARHCFETALALVDLLSSKSKLSLSLDSTFASPMVGTLALLRRAEFAWTRRQARVERALRASPASVR